MQSDLSSVFTKVYSCCKKTMNIEVFLNDFLPFTNNFAILNRIFYFDSKTSVCLNFLKVVQSMRLLLLYKMFNNSCSPFCVDYYSKSTCIALRISRDLRILTHHVVRL